jgi:hypothetical protein
MAGIYKVSVTATKSPLDLHIPMKFFNSITRVKHRAEKITLDRYCLSCMMDTSQFDMFKDWRAGHLDDELFAVDIDRRSEEDV